MSLWIDNNCFSWEEVTKEGSSLAQQFKEEQYHHSLLFCYNWLNNQQEFSFKTSGSTGIPKTISLTRQQMQASAQSTIDALGLTQQDHVFLCLNTQTIGGAMMLVRGMQLLADISLKEASSHPLEELRVNHQYTFASFVPMQLSNSVSDPIVNQKLNRFKHVLVGGAAIPTSLEKVLGQGTAKIYHTYGMTETVSHIALKRLGKDQSFQTVPGVEIKTDERGCLCAKGVVTNNEWVVTNDLVLLIDEHSFEVLGRIDEVINTGGVKVFPGKVEEVLREFFPHRSLFVYGLPDEKLGQKIIAVLEGDEIKEGQWLEAKASLAGKLGKYEWPKEYFSVSHFNKTSSGKVDKLSTLLSLGFQEGAF